MSCELPRRRLNTIFHLMLLICVITPMARAQTFTVIHNFTGGTDGGLPLTGLTEGSNGRFYGTAWVGGVQNGNCSLGCGLIFQLVNSGGKWLETPLYEFEGGLDGANPQGRPIVQPNGTLVGSTENGGGGQCSGFAAGCGTIFTLRPSPTASGYALGFWNEDVLYRFQGGSDGADPFGDVALDAAGNIYGTSQTGGVSSKCVPVGIGCGTAWELSHSGGNWTKTMLWGFGEGTDGIEPFDGLHFDRAGNLYGSTYTGGPFEEGIVFELTPHGESWSESILHSFTGNSDGGLPHSGIYVDGSGNLFGATTDGGSGIGGTVFELNQVGGAWNFNLIQSLTSGGTRQCGPVRDLVADTAGNLYGTTSCDGADQLGSVFELSPSGNGTWTFTSLHDFGGPDGSGPFGNIVIGQDGNLYGTTSKGGQYNEGVIFVITR
jgi:uncharacterized repeat protein (TIGR03803 family)